MFVSDAWPAPAVSHRPFSEHCCDYRSDFMAQSLVLSIDVEDSESHRFQLTFGGVSQGDLGPTSYQELLFERSEFLIATCKKKKTDRLSVRMFG